MATIHIRVLYNAFLPDEKKSNLVDFTHKKHHATTTTMKRTQFIYIAVNDGVVNGMNGMPPKNGLAANAILYHIYIFNLMSLQNNVCINKFFPPSNKIINRTKNISFIH